MFHKGVGKLNNMMIKNLLQQFLIEDLQQRDLTSETIFPRNYESAATIYAKENGIFCGASIIDMTYALLDERITVTLHVADGESVDQNEEIATITGPVRAILSGERLVLNLIQRMSGIATMTHRAVHTLNNSDIKITDTRKTAPGLRMFDKYAVTCGGGYNHRHGLYDGVMIKDNHIAFAGSITTAVERVRSQIGPMVKIEIETETEEEVKEAVQNDVDIIMFDNRTPDEIISLKRHVPHHILTEASGGITITELSGYSKTNVDFISLGFLTHSVCALDISLSMKEE